MNEDWHLLEKDGSLKIMLSTIYESDTETTETEDDITIIKDLSTADKILAETLVENEKVDERNKDYMDNEKLIRSGERNFDINPIMLKVVDGLITLSLNSCRTFIIGNHTNLVFLITTAGLMIGKRYIIYKAQQYICGSYR